MVYNPKKIEKRWQKEWLNKKLYKASEESKKPKYYQLETFPYPSAAGLHIGSPKGYVAEDIHARYMRMKGKEVLYTMGWDAFGLPTENYAIKVGKSPKEVAKASIKNFKRQIQMFGLSYDWDREINTSDPEYYKWTQWLFIQLFKKGLAYRAKAKVNWCPKDQTVLANEQVIDGKCERDGERVIQKEMEQWFLKTTDYADRLINDLKDLDWPEATIKRQKDWIGRSEGSIINFHIPHSTFHIPIFTTRPDTLFGATYMVLAPEHNLVEKLKSKIKNYDEVKKYIDAAKIKTELQRKEEEGEKTGVELKGIKAVNPANNEEIPIWIADYVLMGYGTGAIMAVPAHDERDFEFARKFNLQIKCVIEPTEVLGEGDSLREAEKSSQERHGKILKGEEIYLGHGTMINSGKFDGMDSEKAKWEITKFVGGEKQVQYKLHDWLVSRQRYWGAPIPIIHCDNCGVVPVPEKDLPVKLPDLENYRPKGKPPLAGSEEFIKVKCPKCSGDAKRDSETLDTFVDSSWYYLRYTDPQNKNSPFDKSRLSYWMPVDLYVIGAEHTVLHLLYARFITKFLHDQGYLDFSEPFLKLKHVGLVLGENGQKMSKSRGNVVNPDELIEKFGADTIRLYEMFMGPFEDSHPWDQRGILGAHRFLNRIWNLIMKHKEKEKNMELDKIFHKAIKKVGEDIENFRFNTAISELMKLLNSVENQSLSVSNSGLLLKLLAPFAPHIAEELWSQLGNKNSIHQEEWPFYDPKLIEEEIIDLIIQINGRTRDIIKAPRDLNEDEARELILKSEKIKKYVEDKKIKKFIYIPNRLTNIVI